MKDRPLEVTVENSELVIRIGTATLAFCSHPDNGGPLEAPPFVDARRHVQFAKDVARKILAEDAQGANLINRMLDRAIVLAAEDGSQAMRLSP